MGARTLAKRYKSGPRYFVLNYFKFIDGLVREQTESPYGRRHTDNSSKWEASFSIKESTEWGILSPERLELLSERG